jgi:HrpA-like RNA helicase
VARAAICDASKPPACQSLVASAVASGSFHPQTPKPSTYIISPTKKEPILKQATMTDRRRRIDLSGGDDYDNGWSNKQSKQELNPWTGAAFSQRYYSILEKRIKLPVYQFKEQLVEKVLANQCVVVEGETGKIILN